MLQSGNARDKLCMLNVQEGGGNDISIAKPLNRKAISQVGRAAEINYFRLIRNWASRPGARWGNHPESARPADNQGNILLSPHP